MSDAARLLTKLEIDAIRGRASFLKKRGDPSTISIDALKRSLREDNWDEPSANLFANAPFDVLGLLAHIDILEGMIGDMAGDEGRGIVLRMRRALEEIKVGTTDTALFSWREVHDIAREALQGPK